MAKRKGSRVKVLGKARRPTQDEMEQNIMPGGSAKLNHNQTGRDTTLAASETKSNTPKHLGAKEITKLLNKHLKRTGQIR